MIPKSAEAVQALIMRAGIVVNVRRADRLRLEAIVADRSAPQKHVWRAKVILATADGCGTAEIMRRSGKSKPVVWTWQARFMAEGVEGLLRDKTRKPGKPPLPPNTVQRVGRSGLGAAGGREHPLDGPGTCQGGRSEPAFGATHPGSSPTRAAPYPDVQTVEGPGVCREAQGHRRSMSILPPTPSSSRLMRRVKSRRSTAPGPVCR